MGLKGRNLYYKGLSLAIDSAVIHKGWDGMSKKILFFVILAALTNILAANTVTFKVAQYSGEISYNEEAAVGDAIFSRMTIKADKTKKKATLPDVTAVMQLLMGEKKVDSARFYPIKAKHSGELQFLASVPVTLWAAPDKTYSLKIIFSVADTKKEAVLPVAIIEKKFFSETLDLNEANSNIKQNMTAERMKQIEKLNGILGTIDTKCAMSFKPFIRPVKSQRMTAHFGDKRIYKYTNGKSEASFHYGHDYGVPEETDVFACGDGTVVMAEERISTGWSVVIEHLPGLYSLYYHMSEPLVKVGDKVSQGNRIGLSGSTGLATGPHLHWEVRLHMAAVCPDFFTSDYTFNDVKE